MKKDLERNHRNPGSRQESTPTPSLTSRPSRKTSRHPQTRTPRRRVGACTCPVGTWCQCPAAMPCPPACHCCCQPTPAPCCPPHPPTPQVGGPETVPQLLSGDQSRRGSECCLQCRGAAWAPSPPLASFPQMPPRLVPVGGTVLVVCLCALMSSLHGRQALCHQTVQLEHRFMELGLGGGIQECRLVSGRIRRLLEKRQHGGQVQGD